MARPRPASQRKKRKAAVLIEFAIMLPIFMTIVLGCVDFGRYAFLYIAVTNAARAGAGEATIVRTPTSPATIANWNAAIRKAALDEMMGNTGLTRAETDSLLVVPSPTVTNDAAFNMNRVRIQVSYPFQMLVSWPFIPNQLTLTRAVEMRVIR